MIDFSISKINNKIKLQYMHNIPLASLLLPAFQWLHLRIPMACPNSLPSYSFFTCWSYYQHSLKFFLSFLSVIPTLFHSFLRPHDHMIKALLPKSHWGSTVIMSDLLNNDHVNALSGRSGRVLQRHGPAWYVTESGPPFSGQKFHIMSVIQLLQNAAADGLFHVGKI